MFQHGQLHLSAARQQLTRLLPPPSCSPFSSPFPPSSTFLSSILQLVCDPPLVVAAPALYICCAEWAHAVLCCSCCAVRAHAVLCMLTSCCVRSCCACVMMLGDCIMNTIGQGSRCANMSGSSVQIRLLLLLCRTMPRGVVICMPFHFSFARRYGLCRACCCCLTTMTGYRGLYRPSSPVIFRACGRRIRYIWTP